MYFYTYLVLSCNEGEHPFSIEPTAPVEYIFDGIGSAPNVLMLSIDTLRRDALGRYGGTETPVLDGLAARGVVMERHQTCSAWTYPGVACSLTGQLLYHFGFMPRIGTPGAEMPVLPEGTQTIATRLQASGVQTILLSTSDHLGLYHNTGMGYDLQERLDGGINGAQIAVDRALEVARGPMLDRARPWLLHLHVKDPHAVYEPPAAYRGALEGRMALPWDLATSEGQAQFFREEHSLSAELREEARLQLRLLYDGEVRFMDAELGRLMAGLEGEGLMENTLVVVWNDHGEQFWEHADQGHDTSLHFAENDGVLIFAGAGLEPLAWTQGTTSLDLLPTMLHIFGLPDDDALPGYRIGMAPSDRPRIGALWPRGKAPTQSVTLGEDKLIYRWDGYLEFYQRDRDPTERRNVYDDAPPALEQMQQLLREEVEKMRPAVDGYTPIGLP